MDTRKRPTLWRTTLCSLAVVLLQFNSAYVSADGSNTLGAPTVAIGTGTDIVAAGIGLEGGQPGNIDFTIPATATVKQVLLYWEGYSDGGLGDNVITVEGGDVGGNLIHGTGVPLSLSGATIDSSAYRADITGLGHVIPGANSLTVGGLSTTDFNVVVHGAGVVVIYDDNVSDIADIDLLDGNDFAYQNAGYSAADNVTVPQTLTFGADPDNSRTANLQLIFASVVGDASGGGVVRPNAIDVTVNGVTTTYDNLLDSNDGQEWDTVQLPVTVPAGISSVTVEAKSEDNLGIGADVASMHWIAAALSITPPPPPGGGEGCTPGFWKQKQHFNAWVPPYVPVNNGSAATLFNDVFDDVNPEFVGKTLRQVLKAKGGGINALGRHTVAALLNAANSDIDYGMTPAGVIDAFNAVYPGSKNDYNALKKTFSSANESGCPINGKTAPGE